jgi:hypothetical protein
MQEIPVEEFVKSGLLQEVNRQFFHPRGLALAVTKSDDGTYKLMGVLDSREDPGGYTFANRPAASKAKYAQELFDSKKDYREKNLGYIIQPLDESR